VNDKARSCNFNKRWQARFSICSLLGMPQCLAERAKSRGVCMNRNHKLTPGQQEEVRKRKAAQWVRELGRAYNVSPNAISRIR
jgi:hypothetical protein